MEDNTPALVPVNVIIAGRSYRIRINPSDESFVRKAVKRANDQIGELRRTYAGKDDQDFIAMCLLMYATDPQGTNSSTMQDEEIEELTAKIDAALQGSGSKE
jgi:cell division protein ZapA (FtsZ GTPase activity inhibitor)